MKKRLFIEGGFFILNWYFYVLTMTNPSNDFSQEAHSLKKDTIYEHYKGNRYRILGVARCSETLKEYVVYQGLHGSYDTWIRPLCMFLEDVDINGQIVPRFKKIT